MMDNLRPLRIGACLSLLACLGCSREDHGVSLSNLGGVIRPIGELNVLGMGQSNMSKMSPEGIDIFKRAMLPYNTHVANCAVGGTPITMWQPHTAYFEDCLAQFQRVDAVLWSQGEAETQNDGDALGDLHNAGNWAQLFTNIVREIQRRNPGCKIVFVQIATDPIAYTGRYPGWPTVQAQQASISLAGVRMIRANDLANDPTDNVHFTIDSYKILGARYADALKQLIAG